MFEYLIQNAVEENADICCCGRFDEKANKTVDYTWAEPLCLSREESLDMLTRDERIRNYMWDKLWKRDLFDGISFLEGYGYEDIATCYKLFEKAEKVICLTDAKYHYLIRDSANITARILKNQVDYFTVSKMRLEDMMKRWPSLHYMLEEQCIIAAVTIWCSYFYSPKEMRRQYSDKLQEISDYIKTIYRAHLKTDKIGIFGKTVLRLIPYNTWWAFAGCYAIDQFYMRMRGNHM